MYAYLLEAAADPRCTTALAGVVVGKNKLSLRGGCMYIYVRTVSASQHSRCWCQKPMACGLVDTRYDA